MFQEGQTIVCVDNDDMGDLLVKGKMYQVIPFPARWPEDDTLKEDGPEKVLIAHDSVSIGGKPLPFYAAAYRFRALEEDI